MTEKVSVKTEAKSCPEVGDIRNFFTPTKKEDTVNKPLDAYDFHETNGEIEDEDDEEEEVLEKKQGNEMKSRCPFYTIWICWNMDFPKDMMLV